MSYLLKIKAVVNFTALGLLTFVLINCGGGGGGSTTPVVTTPKILLSGTAAAGAAIIGTVTVKGSTGKTVTALIEANGNYNVDVSTLTAPYMLRAEGKVGGRVYKLHSYVADPEVNGVVNITPFTDLIVANAAGQIAEAYFDNFVANNAATPITAANLAMQEAALQEKLKDVFAQLGVDAAVDLLYTAFSADHTKLDAALDIVRVEVNSATNIATLTNLIDSTTLVDDVTNANDNTASLVVNAGTDLATVSQDYAAIAARFASFSALFATSVPNATQLDPYLSVDFLDSDQGRAAFITSISTDNSLIGLSFQNITIEKLDQAVGTASVTFVVAINGISDYEYNFWQMIKVAGVWKLRGNSEFVSRYSNYICANSYFPDNTNSKTCGINLGVTDNDASNNPMAGVLVDSARVSLQRNGSTVTGTEIYLGVPVIGGFAGALRIYDNDFSDDFMAFGAAALEFNPTLINVGDLIQYELYTATLDITNVMSPVVTGSPIATYTTPIFALPISNAATASYPTTSNTTLTALAAYTGGNLTVDWTVPAAMRIDEVWFQVCDGMGTCRDVRSENLAGQANTTITIDTTGMVLTNPGYSAQLRVYAIDANGQNFLTSYLADATGVGGLGNTTPPPMGLACNTVGGPYSYVDFQSVIASCGPQAISAADIVGKTIRFKGLTEQYSFNADGSGRFTNSINGTDVTLNWMIDSNGYLKVDFQFGANKVVDLYVAYGGDLTAGLLIKGYTEGEDPYFGDLVFDATADGEIFEEIMQDVSIINMVGKTATSVITSSLCAPSTVGGWSYTFSNTMINFSGSDTFDSTGGFNNCIIGATEIIMIDTTTLNSQSDLPFNCVAFPVCADSDFNKTITGVDVDMRSFTSTYVSVPGSNVITYSKTITATGDSFTEVITIN